MNYSLEIRRLAAVDVLEAYDWYELQRAGLGQDFLVELQALYISLITHPFNYSFYIEPIRQAKINRFPYTVVFEVIDQKVVVYSVFMTRKNPSSKRIN